MINGHTHGQYLDHPSLHPFWERAEALGGTLSVASTPGTGTVVEARLPVGIQESV